MHPGMIKTNLGRHMGGVGVKLLGVAMLPFMVSVPRGAATSCFVATHPDLVGVTGRWPPVLSWT